MPADFDFLELYRDLGVGPEDGVDALRDAFRRRVARLHPDRGTGEHELARLKWLNGALHAALDFQRRHGRLPGARVRSDEHAALGALVEPARAARRSAWSMLAVAVVVLLLGTAAWWPMAESPSGSTSARARARPTATIGAELDAAGESARNVAPERLAPGLTESEVRSLVGEPLHVRDGRWEYGPSWIAFEEGRVVDWYSSPMRPLE